MAERISRDTILLTESTGILSYASVVGKKEGEGPLGRYFDLICPDTTLGEETWEKSEGRMQKNAVLRALSKGNFSASQAELLFAGDLLNQCISSSYGLRDLSIPFYGLYGACSTMIESLSLSALLADSGILNCGIAVTSSHFCSAERQFRQPLEYGGQRPPTSQWTVTGAGAAVVGKASRPPYIRAVTTGKIIDLGIRDINNMGAAMAPAACHTICTFLRDTGTSPDDYDLILTGDLGWIGSDLLLDLSRRSGVNLFPVHQDCGKLIYDPAVQDVHAGGSGCGCCASVLCSYILKQMEQNKIRNVLVAATGALMSTTSFQQGESIPGIAHLVWLSNTQSDFPNKGASV